MPEQNQDRDNLERFFQKATSQTDIEYNEGDWLRLQAMLDERDARLAAARSRKLRTAGISAISLGILLMALYLLTQPSTENKEIIADKKDLIEEPENTSSPEVARAQQKDVSPSLPHKQEWDSRGEDTAREEQMALNKESKESYISGVSHSSKSIVPPADVQETGIKDEMNGRNEQIEPGKEFRSDWPSATTVIDRDKLYEDFGLKRPVTSEIPVPERTSSIAMAKDEQSEDDESKKLASPGWSFLLSVSPDFSSTRLGRYASTPGEAFGLMVHYHFHPSLSLSTGLVRSSKVYTCSGSEYNLPRAYWERNTNGVVPESVDGACTVLEIPVALQFKVWERGWNKWLVSGGVSNYVMLDESYRYIFREPNPGAKKGWESSETSRFPFSIFHLAIGYERSLGRNMSIGLEPYVKIPMKEIGWSHLKLFTTGASLTFRYHVLKRAHPDISLKSRSPG